MRLRKTIWVPALLVFLVIEAAAHPAEPPEEARGTEKEPAPEQLHEPKKLPPERNPGGVELPACPLTPIDLRAALQLAGVENPQILIARQRVVEAIAVHQYNAAQLLPSLNLGLNYDAHTGPLQQSSGNILRLDRSAMYVGAGANAVGSGTVNVPGLVYNLNVSEAIFNGLITSQGVERAEFAAVAVQNETFRQVAVAYAELLRAEGRRSIAQQTYDEASEVARTAAAFGKAGQIALADEERAKNEQARRRIDLIEARVEVVIASARLAELLALDKALCLHPIEDRVVPTPIVPDPIPLCELLGIAIVQRPELREWQAAVRQALLGLDSARVLPFSPNVILGLSGGDFGGGSSITHLSGQPLFGNFGQRNDFDAVVYWTLRNVGVGNDAMVKIAASRVGIAELEKLRVFNQVRREVAEAAVRTHARFRQIASAENAVQAGQKAFDEDFRRIRGGEGRPLELLESLRLLGQARNLYLDAIVDYNEAQIDLYVALGKPPADVLARPVPTNFAAPLPQAEEKKR